MALKLNSDELFDLAQYAEVDLDNFRTDYSGRGMRSKTCLALTVQGSGIPEVVGVALAATDTLQMDIYDAKEAFGDPRVDRMGLDTILYWPLVTVTDDED